MVAIKWVTLLVSARLDILWHPGSQLMCVHRCCARITAMHVVLGGSGQTWLSLKCCWDLWHCSAAAAGFSVHCHTCTAMRAMGQVATATCNLLVNSTALSATPAAQLRADEQSPATHACACMHACFVSTQLAMPPPGCFVLHDFGLPFLLGEHTLHSSLPCS